jgi:CDP-glucose 4,6-dehydratase
LSGYLSLTEHLYSIGDNYLHSWNFGPGTSDFMSVGDIINFIQTDLTEFQLGFEVRQSDLHEAKILKLDNSVAKKNLDWSSHWNSKTAILKTFQWYQDFFNGAEPYNLTLNQIKEFQK